MKKVTAEILHGFTPGDKILLKDACYSKNASLTGLYKTQLLIKCWKAYRKNIVYNRLTWQEDKEGVHSFV